MQFHVSTGDGLPIYRQIVRQVEEGVAGGRLSPGDRLPSQRRLAEELVIAPLTVKKAYDELEGRGVIRAARGLGTFVSAEPPRLSEREQAERLRASARRLAAEAALLGVPLTRLIELLRVERARLRREGRG